MSSVTLPKNVQGGPCWIFNIHFVTKSQKLEDGTRWCYQKTFENKSHSAQKIRVKNTNIAKVGIISVFSRFWTSVLFLTRF